MYLLSSHIITPLGEGLAANYDAIMQGKSALRRYENPALLPTPFFASLFKEGAIDLVEGYSRFESLCIRCAAVAIKKADIDTADGRTLFVLSSTKGNIEALATTQETETVGLAESAQRIARYFGNHNAPLVVSNACTSGVCAQIAALRLLRSGYYDHAVIIGCDVQSAFIISGFQSLKALSDEPCMPYDADRKGLNLGEAAACMVLSNRRKSTIELLQGSICNDANHISGPSRTAEGSLRVLQEVIKDVDKQKIAVINAHGTSTIYNDEMESIAVERAGLQEITVNSLKSVFGHTMGAAGILESLLTAYALERNTILPTRNFHKLGVSRAIKVSSTAQQITEKPYFIKLLSGFGGCNAAMLYKIGNTETYTEIETYREFDSPKLQSSLSDIHRVCLSSEKHNLTDLYHQYAADYPKFLKMDLLSKTGFIAAELLAHEETLPQDCAVLIFTHAGSLRNDIRYQHTIADFPSPALFVYTLPNIVTGEIAIRHHLLAETSCYVLPNEDWNMMRQVVAATMQNQPSSMVLYGWVDTEGDNFFADIRLATIKKY